MVTVGMPDLVLNVQACSESTFECKNFVTFLILPTHFHTKFMTIGPTVQGSGKPAYSRGTPLEATYPKIIAIEQFCGGS